MNYNLRKKSFQHGAKVMITNRAKGQMKILITGIVEYIVQSSSRVK